MPPAGPVPPPENPETVKANRSCTHLVRLMQKRCVIAKSVKDDPEAID